jgi:UDP-N-acetylglucosamine--N-acetylmuramyl-(pentapeptide) pyrophosphoryl-undecaprenol N-acetylglucosamine transferase
MLGRKATRIFTGTEGMEKFFPASRVMVTGNPVRTAITASTLTRAQGIQHFGLDESKRTVLVVGGSLGARAINEAIDKGLDELERAGIQLIWQTGKPYAETAKARAAGRSNVWVSEFISNMEYAYAAADVVVSRSGAMAVAELCVAKKAALFVPYPFAAEDHQTVNAEQLVNRNAALMVKDTEAARKLVFMTIELSKDPGKQQELRQNIATLAITNADEVIAGEILKSI